MIVLLKAVIYMILNGLGYLFPDSEKRTATVFLRLDALGDFVLWAPMAQEYKKRHPNEKVILICSAGNAYVAEKSKAYDEIIICQKQYLSHFLENPFLCVCENLKISRIICKKLIVPVYSRSIEHGIASYLIKAKEKIAIDGDATGMESDLNERCNKIFDSFITTSSENIHELCRNAEFMSTLCGEKIETRIANLRDESEPIIDQKYFVVMPGASISWKCWNINKFVELSKKIQDKKGYVCVLCGDSREKEFYERFEKRDGLQCINKIGQTNIKELINIIQNAEFFVGNDSAGVHIAAATGTKTICILHGAHFGRFLPYPNLSSNIPISVYLKKECFGCALGRSDMGCYTKDCKNNIEQTGRFLCLEDIDEELIYSLI